MSPGKQGNDDFSGVDARGETFPSRSVEVRLSDEEIAAVEGWRAANRVGSKPEAVRELVRLGLLSEIARVYRLVGGIRGDGEEAHGSG